MKRITLAVLLLGIFCGAFLAAEPPALINYQGVLRDASDNPLDGLHDMGFAFWSSAGSGDEILIDRHQYLDDHPVIVNDGLFSVQLGGGIVVDGSGPGTYTSLADVFRDYSMVWLEIEVGGETLSPRVRIVSAAYALNADRLDGVDSTQLIRSNSSDVYEFGTLTFIDGTTLDVNGTFRMDGPVTKSSTALVTNFNADLLDGYHAGSFAAVSHGHAGGDITGPVAEATNTDMVDGMHASAFIDTTAGAQTKPGPLTVDAGAIMTSTGVTGYGTDRGGYFADNDSSGYAEVGDGDYGIRAFGNEMGGYFEDADGTGYARLGFNNWGIRGFGNGGGGYFEDLDSSGYADVAYGDRGIEAFGNFVGGKFGDLDNSGVAHVGYGDRGIEASGTETGGYFSDSDGSGQAYVGYGDYGIQGYGSHSGGHFNDSDGSGHAYVGAADYGIRSYGNFAGGYFDDTNGSGQAYVAYDDRGIYAFGNETGGYFKDDDSSGYAFLGYGDYGVYAQGDEMGGYFKDRVGSGYAYVGYDDHGIRAWGNSGGGYFEDLDGSGNALVGFNDRGIQAHGEEAGGYFSDMDSSGYAWVALGDRGIEATGNEMGGYFADADSSGYAHVGVGDFGIRGYGNSGGGYFNSLGGSGWAQVGFGNRGIEAFGTVLGGKFQDLDSSGLAYVAYGDHGIEAFGNGAGGFFVDSNGAGYAYVGMGNLKIAGNGGVSFVQNHPENDQQVVVYTAPEGDEVATYTRGTARLVDGEARVALGETFGWVTNPDIGLTAWVTPIGDWSDLYVAEKSTTELVVRSRVGAPDVAFDFIVYGLRIGFEEVSVVQEKDIESFIPSMKDHRERYARQPELRRYNALERFKEMHADVTRTDVESLDLSASVALRDAIHEYDTATDPPVHELFGHDRGPAAEGPRDSSARARGPLDSTAAPVEPDESASLWIDGPLSATDPEAPAEETLPDNLFPVSEDVEPGDLVALDSEEPGRLRRAETIADPGVVGIVAGDPSEVDGELQAPVALFGLAVVKADASYGAILAGDLLTTSPTAGHAMVAIAPTPGTVIGKALEPLDIGTGMVRVVVMLR